MGFAEKKIELFQLIETADETIASKLIEFSKQLNKASKFTSEELAKFHASRLAYLDNPQNTISLEDAHDYIRSLKKK